MNRRVALIMSVMASMTCLSYALRAQRVATINGNDTNAADVDALLTRRVTVDVTNVSLETAIQTVGRLAQVTVLTDHSALLRYDRLVTLHTKNETLRNVFDQLLVGTPLQVVARPNKRLIVSAGDSTNLRSDAVRESGIVTGRVIDSATGRGLKGVTVAVAGTKLGAVTADSGQFTLRNVPVGDQLVTARSFGYLRSERAVTVMRNEPVTLRIGLVVVPNILSGVVTTATGVQRKVEVGNDITALNVDSIMRVAPITSVTTLLETRVPGLTVMHSTGVPGDPSRLRLRGAGSVQLNNDPIVVVDGIRVYASQSDARNQNLAPTLSSTSNGNSTSPLYTYAAPSPLDQIDPNSIETIEVFKGPSATAIYGSDAASGVIVITTKRGRAGPTHWNLQVGQGVNWIPGTWPAHDFRFGYDPTGNSRAVGGLCSWIIPGCTVDSIVAFQALNDPRYTVFSHGQSQTANLNVSGGSATLLYNLSGSGSSDLGNLRLPSIEQQRYTQLYGATPRWMLRPDRYHTWGVRGTLTAQPNTSLQVQLSSSLFNSTQQRSSLEQAIPQLEGEYINSSTVFPTSYVAPYNLSTAPLITNDVERATDRQLTATNVLQIGWRPLEWLPITVTGGLNSMQRTDETYVPFGVNSAGPGAALADTTGSFGSGRGSTQDNTLSLSTEVPVLQHHVLVTAGGNYHSGSADDFKAYTDQLAPGVSSPTSFTCPNDPHCFTTAGTSAAVTYGWFLEPRLNVASRFFVAPGFRLDGGSGGSQVTNSGGFTGGLSAFPKIDFSWIAVDRQDGKPLWGALTLLRPRIAFGLAGVQPGPADKLRLFNVGDYRLSSVGGNGNLATNAQYACRETGTLDGGLTTVPTVCLNGLGNTHLRPERARELEAGFDATFWQQRLTLTYSQYNKTRHDAILAIDVAPSVVAIGGDVTQYQKNIGVIRNTGREITVNTILVQNRAFSWNIGANYSNNNSLVVRLNADQAPFCITGRDIQEGGSCIKPGYPLFGEWAQPIASFADVNHDGVIEPNEFHLVDSAVYVGQAEPKYQLNLSTGLTVLNGRLGLNATFAYQNGLTQMNQGALNSGGLFLLPNTPSTPLATQAGIVATCQVPVILAMKCGIGSSIGLMQTVNTFRFNDLSINFELPKTFSSMFRVPRASIALQGSNLALHTNYRGKDPNVNAFATVSAGDETSDLGEIPEPRTWWLKVNLGN